MTIEATKTNSISTSISTFLNLLWQDGEVREIRIFQDKSIFFGYFSSPQIAEKEIKRFINNSTIYITLNPCKKECLARVNNQIRVFMKGDNATTDKEIIALQYLLIDLDPVRITGISSSQEEKERAFALAQKIKEKLGEPYIFGDSGNGYHLIYKHTCKNAEQLKSLLETLSSQFPKEEFGVEIDKKVFNPSRISKILGTWARKGENIPERPHRISQILSSNINQQPLNIQNFISIEDKKEKPIIPLQKGSFEIRTFLANHGVVVTKEKEWQGNTMLCLEHCIFDENHTKNEAAIIIQPSGKLLYQCFHNSCQGKTWKEARELLEPKQPCLCIYCNQEICFDDAKVSKNGKKIPLNSNGEPHDCLQRREKTKQKPEKIEIIQEETEPEAKEVLRNIPFPIQNWHPIHARYLSGIEELTDCPNQFITQAFIVALGSILGNKVWLDAGFGFYPNLYCALLGNSTDLRKSTSMRLGIRPLTLIDNDLFGKFEQDILVWKEANKDKERKTQAPIFKSLVYPDESTPEALLEMLGNKADGLFQFSELATFLAVLNRSYNGGLKEFMTTAYDVVDRYVTKTKKNGFVIIKKPAPSIISCSTIDWLRENIRSQDFKSGFMARFLITIMRMPEKKVIALPKKFAIDSSWVEFFKNMMNFAHIYQMSESCEQYHADLFHQFREKYKEVDEFAKPSLGRLEAVLHKYAVIYQAVDDVIKGTKSEHIEEQNYNFAYQKVCWDADNFLSCYFELFAPPSYEEERIYSLAKKYSNEDGVIVRSALAQRSRLKIKEFAEIIETLKIKGYVVEQKRGKFTYYKVSK